MESGVRGGHSGFLFYGVPRYLDALSYKYSKLAAVLEAQGVKTQRGGEWTPTGVKNIMKRAKKLADD